MTGQRSSLPILLIVDDEARILSALRRVLRREGYQVVTAGDAREGLSRLSEGRVDAVLSDHKMPGMGGLEFLARVASLQPQAARLLITGWPGEVPPARVQALGIRAVIPKPWDDAELKATLRKVLG